MTKHDELVTRQRAAVDDGLLAASKRLRWSRERLAAERERRLRNILTWSTRQSPFHRDRLAGVDTATFTVADLGRIPPMTKQDMMDNFDRIVTDGALTLTRVNTHLEHLDDDSYLLDKYRTIVSGGSSGYRGVFVYGWDDWATFVLLQARWEARLVTDDTARGSRVASLFAKEAKHVSGAMHAFLADASDPICHLPATLPLRQLVAGLNAAQPVRLQGYPTVIGLLADEALAGRLHIGPSQIRTCGELLTDDVREAARSAWGVEIFDFWGASEGVYAYPCGQGPGMHLPDDLVIVEPVDESGRPVPPGMPAAKIYLTNLYNFAQPLIRYELADALTLLDGPCPCGCAHSRIDKIVGRFEDVLKYPGGVAVNPLGFDAALLRNPEVTEGQVLQTRRGVRVLVRVKCRTDLATLRNDIHSVLTDAGLQDPEVTVHSVDALDRLWSGKLRRFVPIPGGLPA